MNTKVFLTLFALSALCLCVYGGNITPFLINVAPSWGRCYDTSMNPLPSGCAIQQDTSTSPITSIISWGQLAPGQNLTSRVRVRGPAASSSVDAGTGGLFLLSNITHDNYLVTNQALIPRYLDLDWAVQVTDVTANQTIPLQITGLLEVVETPNVASEPAGSAYCDYTAEWQTPYGVTYTSSVPCCPYPTIANDPCSDRLTASISNGGSAPVVVNGITYQIIIKGFCADPTSVGCNFDQTYSFISQEEFSSTRYLFASLIVVCGTNTASCTERAADISVCTSGTCTSGQCSFGVNQATLGNTCTPSDPLATACGSNFKCAATNSSSGGTVGLCEATTFAPLGTNCSVTGLGPKPCQVTQCTAGNSCNYVKLPINTACGSIAPTQCQSHTCQSTQTTDGIDCLIYNQPTSTPCTGATNPQNLDTATCSYPRCSSGTCTYIPNTSVNGQPCGSNNANNVCSPNVCYNGMCTNYNAQNFTNVGCTPGSSANSCSGTCCTTYCNGQGQCIYGTKSSSTGCALPPQGNSNDNCNFGQCAGNGATNFGGCVASYNTSSTQCNTGANTQCVTYYCNGRGVCVAQNKPDYSSCTNPNTTPNQCQVAGCSSGTCTALSLTDTQVQQRMNAGQTCTPPQGTTYSNCSIPFCNNDGQCVIQPRAATTTSNGVASYVCSSVKTGPCAYYGCDGNNNCVLGYFPKNSNTPGCQGQNDTCTKNFCPGPSNPNCVAFPIENYQGTTSCSKLPNGNTLPAGGCQYGICSGGSCTSNNAAANSTCTTVTASGPCERAACDSNGNCQVLPYNNPKYCTVTNACYNPICAPSNGAYTCQQIYNNNTCNTANPAPTDPTGYCQVQQCSSGTCKVVNLPDNSYCTKSGSPGTCRKWGCVSGSCQAVISAGIGCTGSPALPCFNYACNPTTGSCDPSPNDSNQCNNGTIDACHNWKCSSGSCLAVAGNNGASCTGSTSNPCIKYSCNAGTCSPDVNAFNNISCPYANLPQCKKAICSTGQCIAVNAFDGNNCDANVTLNNPCNVRTCQAGICTNQVQTGKSCSTNGPDTLCLSNTCQGTTCAQANRNEDVPCDPTQANTTGDAACRRSVCVSGQCTSPTSYWDGQPCGQGSQGVCSQYLCMSGRCDTTTNYAIPAGTSCSQAGNPCVDYECNGAYQCISTNSAGAACYNPVLTFKRGTTPTNVTLLASGCQAYTCSGGSCTTQIQNIDGGICIGNFTDSCLSGLCAGGKCLPTIIANCSLCGQYKDCKSCQAGSFSSKRSTAATDFCRLNPNLAGCIHDECSWCDGQCLSTSEVTEYNTYYPPGSSNNKPCTGQCPVALVGGDGNNIALPLGLGLGLGGGAAALLALAAVAAIIAIIVKRKLATPDANMATTAFVDSKATAVNPLHETDTAVKTNALHVG